VSETKSRSGNSNLILAAMIFAVAMTFIDQTIVSISIPQIQDDLHLSATGVQWVINGYLLTLAALFAFGGKIADVYGRKRMVITGILIFAGASTMCGFTPEGSIAEAWIIFWRVIQGAGAAIMFPAALAIVISAFPMERRGKALALFFGLTGVFTSIGPIAGGYLSEWTWRAIFWINIPVALLSLYLIHRADPEEHKHPEKIDMRGAVLISGGMGLLVLGLQQSAVWGWSNPATWACIVIGALVLVGFVFYELKLTKPLIRVQIFKDRAFAVDCAILFLLSIPFVPLFFFASVYSQVSLGWEASESGLYLLVFFGGFAVASQWGGRILDAKGARPAVILGSWVAALGFYLWAGQMTDLSAGLNGQWYYIVLAGAGIGLVLSPASTDAINRAPKTSYGEATGITQTVRNFGASLGLAVLGTILTLQTKSNIQDTFASQNPPIPKAEADKVTQLFSTGGASGGSGSGGHEHIFALVQGDYAHATQTVFYVMAAVMAVCFLVAIIGSPKGKMVEVPVLEEDESPEAVAAPAAVQPPAAPAA
jgi:EmrB/QacA subfamily drug resistance transporter